jgi:hypothetical protein
MMGTVMSDYVTKMRAEIKADNRGFLISVIAIGLKLPHQRQCNLLGV